MTVFVLLTPAPLVRVVVVVVVVVGVVIAVTAVLAFDIKGYSLMSLKLWKRSGFIRVCGDNISEKWLHLASLPISILMWMTFKKRKFIDILDRLRNIYFIDTPHLLSLIEGQGNTPQQQTHNQTFPIDYSRDFLNLALQVDALVYFVFPLDRLTFPLPAPPSPPLPPPSDTDSLPLQPPTLLLLLLPLPSSISLFPFNFPPLPCKFKLGCYTFFLLFTGVFIY